MSYNSPKNLYEMIHKSRRLPEVGEGWDAIVYPIAGSEGKYVLRVPHDKYDDIDALSTSTSLTPINCGLNSRLMAPPLLENDTLSIHARQPGRSLQIYWESQAIDFAKDGLKPAEAKQKAYVKVLERLSGQSPQSFLTFLQDINYLTSRRRGIDPIGDNIMVSKNTLRWVDIGHEPQNNHLANVEQMMLHFTKDFKPVRNEEVLQLERRIKAKLNQAAKLTRTPRTEAEVKSMIPAFHPFAEKSEIEEIARVPLSATPRKVQESLRKIENHIERIY